MNRDKILLIDSSKRTTTAIDNFKVNLKYPIECRACALQLFTIPLTWYNLKWPYTKAGVIIQDNVYSSTLPDGRYKINEILELTAQGLTDDSGIDFTLTADPNTGLVTIATSTNFEIVQQSTDSLLYLLGFTSARSNATSYVSDVVPPFYSLDKYLTLKIDYLEGNIETINGEQKSDTFIIQLPNLSTYNFGDKIIMEEINDSKIIFFDNVVKLQAFNVSLYNDNGEAIDLNNNNYFFQLKLYK